MKTTVFLILGLWFVIVAADTVLQWQPSTGAEGYNIYIEPTPIAGSPAQYSVVGEGSTTFDATAFVSTGTQYEAWVTAYLTTPDPYESAESNHVRFTPPLPPEVITVPAQPQSLLIQFAAP